MKKLAKNIFNIILLIVPFVIILIFTYKVRLNGFAWSFWVDVIIASLTSTPVLLFMVFVNLITLRDKSINVIQFSLNIFILIIEFLHIVFFQFVSLKFSIDTQNIILYIEGSLIMISFIFSIAKLAFDKKTQIHN